LLGHPHGAMGSFMLMCVAAFGVLAVCGATSTTRKMPKKCRKVVCESLQQYEDANCEDWEIAKVIIQKYHPHHDNCCQIMKCTRDPQQPCGGKVCRLNNIAEANTDCNEIYPDDPVWDSLQPEKGAMYATLRRPAMEGKKGRCCDEYKCRTNHTILCDNLNAKNPCPDHSSCPLCHKYEIVTPASPEDGKCCPEARCVPDHVCLCSNMVDTCPEPVCDEDHEYPIVLFEADPAAHRCCPIKTCQANLTSICEAERARISWVPGSESNCAPCEQYVETRVADYAQGRCLPEFKCIPLGQEVLPAGDSRDLGFPSIPLNASTPVDKCCGFNTASCLTKSDFLLGQCEYVEEVVSVDTFNGPCCPKFKVFVNHTCTCENTVCPFTNATVFKEANCPETHRGAFKDDKADHWAVDEVGANPDLGICCPKFTCRKTAERLLWEKRKAEKVWPQRTPPAQTTRRR